MAAARANNIDADNEWEDVPASQQVFDEDVDEEIYSQEDDVNYETASPELQQPSSSKSKGKMLRIVSDDEDATAETEAKKRKLLPQPPPLPSSSSTPSKSKQPANNGARGKKQKTIDDGKKINFIIILKNKELIIFTPSPHISGLSYQHHENK